MNRLRVLVVDSNGPEAERLADRLASADHSALPANGLEEASEALFVQKFDAVLLASELPRDGVKEFTAKLRELERGQRSAVPAPVLSISSEVPDGKPWCVGEHGIDAYLAESFLPLTLLEAVASLSASIARGTETGSNAIPELPLFEKEHFFDHVARDQNLMREIINLFLAEAPAQVIELREAVSARDFKRAVRVAHTMKGSLATLHAQSARSRAQQLETAAKDGNAGQCRESLSALEYDLEVLEPQLLSFRDSTPGI